MTSAGMTSAAIYARVSSARQKKDETIASQTAALRAHAEQLGLDVPEEWVFEDEGHSGATLVRPALERLRDLVAGVGIDVVLCYSPDRLARKFAYQALLIEEFTRAGTRVEFVKGPRGDSPEDQLLVQFQGMFAEYEKAQILERYRRGKTHRAKTGSINVLCGAPFGYRYVRKNAHTGAGLRDRRTRGRAGRRAVPPLRRRRRLHRRPGPLAHRAAGAHPHRQAPLGPQRGLGHAAQPRLRRPRGVRQDHGRARVSRPEPGRPAAGPLHPAGVQDRRPAPRRGDRDPGAGHRQRGHLRPGRPAAGRQQALRLPQQPQSLAAAGPGRLLGLRLRLLPHLHPHHQQEDPLLPVPGQRRLPLRGRPGLRQQAGPRRLPRHRGLGPHHRVAGRPRADPRRDRQTPRTPPAPPTPPPANGSGWRPHWPRPAAGSPA